MPSSYYIAVSGLQGAGKSTLARSLARRFGWEYVAESKVAQEYLPDLFKDEARWAFETQLGFFCNKAVRLVGTLKNGSNVILDRSLYEDRDVFAECFRRNEKISKRAFATYTTLADYFLSTLPTPDLVVYCQCSLATARVRIEERNRVIQKNYPANHLEQVCSLYEEWVAGFTAAPLFLVDSEVHDFRRAEVSEGIAADVEALIRKGEEEGTQLELGVAPTTPSTELRYLQSASNSALDFRHKRGFVATTFALSHEPNPPYAYIAAPFSSVATTPPAASAPSAWFEDAPPHGTIVAGRFRSALLAAGRAVESMGLEPLIPHRDVNKWGQKILTPEEVFVNCTRHVTDCELFVGILGHSAGAHYEFGVAQALRKPIVLVKCAEIATSFLGQGAAAMGSNVLVVTCERLEEIGDALRSRQVKDFIRTHCYNELAL